MNNFWCGCYEGVVCVNEVLCLLVVVIDVSVDDVIRIFVEVCLLRGYYYFDFKKYYNNILYIDEMFINLEEIVVVFNFVDVWGKIEVDF